MRLFFALWPPHEAARALAAWAGEVQQRCGGRATAQDTIHLTLAFLGEADARQAAEAARRVCARRFSLPIQTSRYWRHNLIVWAGPSETPPRLAELAERLQLELFRAGFILERRPFAAHVTLVRKARAPGTLPAVPAVDWPAPEFVLVRSTPTASGARYEVVDRFPLSD